LGYSFLPAYWGRGYATEVTKEGLNYFLNKTPLLEIFAVIETPNIVSKKVLLKCGFKYFEKKIEEGKELEVYVVKKQF
jgi:ribosomal-protein-alanine N-acetyltransferase